MSNSTVASPNCHSDPGSPQASTDKPLLLSVWQNVAPKARRLSLHLKQKEPRLSDSTRGLGSSISASLVDVTRRRSRRLSRPSPALSSTVPTTDDIIDVLYPSNRHNDSPDLRHRGDLAHTSDFASSSHNTMHRSRSNSAPLSPRPSDGPEQPSHSPPRIQSRHIALEHASRTDPVDALGLLPTSTPPETQHISVGAEGPSPVRRSVYRSGGSSQRPTSTPGSWEALLRAAAARSDTTAPVRSRESIARTSLILTDIPVSNSAHFRTNRDPEALGCDPPPPYARYMTDAPPVYDGHGLVGRLGLTGLTEFSEESVENPTGSRG
ncbi:hypothetical protein OF83DRAFT_1148473 [Amylostereum chailletii]|nr:hypothetical protein OF83DRAFT_1148473 [Amylostereum chailletii]